MKVDVAITDDSLRRNLTRLVKESPQELGKVADVLAAQGREFARDIITVQIYATPQRGGYKRTRNLIRSIYSASDKTARYEWAVIVGASASYAAYNEFGTYEGYAGDGDAERQIIADARRTNERLITLEYGSVEKGLEPRPYILPAIIMVERELGDLLSAAVRRLLNG